MLSPFYCMKSFRQYLAVILVFVACRYPAAVWAQGSLPKYEPTVSKELYDKIVYLDSLYFAAYNQCNMAVLDSLMSDNLEFYHDKGGFSDSKTATLATIEKNICGKVTRELLKGSIEVYGIKNYGAVEIGFHGFHNSQEKAPEQTHFSKFIVIWRYLDNRWQMSRVISLH